MSQTFDQTHAMYQRLFDMAMIGLAKQGAFAYNPINNKCFYTQKSTGNHCVVGLLWPPELQDSPEVEFYGIAGHLITFTDGYTWNIKNPIFQWFQKLFPALDINFVARTREEFLAANPPAEFLRQFQIAHDTTAELEKPFSLEGFRDFAKRWDLDTRVLNELIAEREARYAA